MPVRGSSPAFLLLKSGDALAQLPMDVGQSPFLEVFRNCGDVAVGLADLRALFQF